MAGSCTADVKMSRLGELMTFCGRCRMQLRGRHPCVVPPDEDNMSVTFAKTSQAVKGQVVACHSFRAFWGNVVCSCTADVIVSTELCLLEDRVLQHYWAAPKAQTLALQVI